MQRYTKENMKARAAFLRRMTNAPFEYESGGSGVYYKFVASIPEYRQVTIVGRTKRELIDASHDFMEGYWLAMDAGKFLKPTK